MSGNFVNRLLRRSYRDYYLAACAGLIAMGLAGEKAAAGLSGSEGGGSFKAKLMDGIDTTAWI